MAQITITLSTKKANFLKKILNTTDLDVVVNKHFEDWVNNIVDTKFKTAKTVDQQIDEILNN